MSLLLLHSEVKGLTLITVSARTLGYRGLCFILAAAARPAFSFMYVASLLLIPASWIVCYDSLTCHTADNDLFISPVRNKNLFSFKD
jgi:hypothetical protein